MLVGVCSAKGSPGVTTTALALAARWPGAQPVLVEADPAGGDLSARFQVPPSPGLVSLATASRRTRDPALLAEHSQVLPGGIAVVVGPPGAEQARAALDILGTRGLGLLRAVAGDPDSLVLLDAGRVDPPSPAVALLRGASAVLVLARPRAEELAHAAGLLAAVPAWTRRPGLVLAGPGYSRAEVEQELGIPVLAALPDDPRGVEVLYGGPGHRGVPRSALGIATARLAGQVAAHIAAQPAPGPATGSTGPGCRDRAAVS